MSASQRRKGKSGELECVALAKEAGFPRARRNGDAGQADGDLAGIPGAYIEVRRRERVRVSEWMDEVEAECPAHSIPVLAFRRSRDQWRACLPLTDLLALLKAAQQ